MRLDLSKYYALGQRSSRLEALYAYWMIIGVAVLCTGLPLIDKCISPSAVHRVAVLCSGAVGICLVTLGAVMLRRIRRSPETPLLSGEGYLCFFTRGRWYTVELRRITEVQSIPIGKRRGDGYLRVVTEDGGYLIPNLRSVATLKRRIDARLGDSINSCER